MELDPRRLVVVTGAGGFIGGHLVAELKNRGHERIRAVDLKPLGRWYQEHEGVENVSADLREVDPCQAVSADATYVFNLAADMGGMGFIETHKADCMVSVLINTNMLIAARDHGVEHFMFGSSACVYNGERQTDPNVTALKESDAYPALPEDGYGWEKLFSERMCRHFMEDEVHEPINLGSSQLVSINELVDIVEGIAGVKLDDGLTKTIAYFDALLRGNEDYGRVGR